MCAICIKNMYVLYGCLYMGVYGCVWVCMGGSLSSAAAGNEGGGGGGSGDASFRFRISHPNLPGLGFRV